MSTQQPTIIYTLTDEAPRLATASFLPIVRTFAPFVAGMGAMTYKRFMAFNFVGGALRVCAFLYAGHMFGNVPVIRKNFTLLVMGIIVISLLPILVETIRHRCKRTAEAA